MADVIITWGDRKAEWDFDDITYGEAAAIERVTGGTLKQFRLGLAEGDETARRAMIWIAFKRETPDLAWSDLDDVKRTAFNFEVVKPAEEGTPADPQEPGDGPAETSPSTPSTGGTSPS